MSLLLIGISHRVAPVEMRERVALGIDEAAALARELAADACEAVCLSTCNRTELYLAGEETLPDAAARAVTALAILIISKHALGKLTNGGFLPRSAVAKQSTQQRRSSSAA